MRSGAACGEKAWWETRLFMALLIVGSVVPLLWPSLPPLIDLPAHLARYRVQLGLSDSPWLQHYYGFKWALVGNLGVDVLLQGLAPLLGLEPATKLVTLCIPALFATGLLATAREVHGRLPPTAAFAVPLAYSGPFLYGFLNYMLSVALALLAFALWLRLGRLKRSRARALAFVPIALLLYFTHIYGWGILGLLCFSAESIRAHDEREIAWPRALLEAAIACLVLAAPVLFLLAAARDAGSGSFQNWFDLPVKFQWLLSPLRDRWKLIDFPAGILCFAIILFSRIHPGLAFSRPLAAGALVLAVACLLFPFRMLNSAAADMRLLPIALAIGLLALDCTDRASRRFVLSLAFAATAFFGMRTIGTTVSFAIAAHQQDERLGQIAALPRGARLAALVGSDCKDPWPLLRDSHLASMVTVRRDGFSNDQWTGPGINLLNVRYRPAGRFAADPWEMVQPKGCVRTWTVDEAIQQFPRGSFDYLWLLDTQSPDASQLWGLQLVSSKPGSMLYRVMDRSEPS
jgi:hypothetical protein